VIFLLPRFGTAGVRKEEHLDVRLLHAALAMLAGRDRT
jgi:hypothetical protein